MKSNSSAPAVFVAVLLTASCAASTASPPATEVRVTRAQAVAPSTPAPPCLDPVAHAQHINNLIDDEGRAIQTPAAQVIDLDDDGAPDLVLAADRDATTTRYEMYVRANRCDRYVGGVRLEGTIVGTLAKRSHGLSVLEVVDPCRDACTHHELRFNGSSWAFGDSWTVPKQ